MLAGIKDTKLAVALLPIAVLCACGRSRHEEQSRADASSLSTQSAEIGLPECDDYLSKVRQCIENAPAERKKSLEENLARTRATWKTLAENAGARPGLPQACRLALQTAQRAMKQYACAW
jgi:hypothetical protein